MSFYIHDYSYSHGDSIHLVKFLPWWVFIFMTCDKGNELVVDIPRTCSTDRCIHPLAGKGFHWPGSPGRPPSCLVSGSGCIGPSWIHTVMWNFIHLTNWEVLYMYIWYVFTKILLKKVHKNWLDLIDTLSVMKCNPQLSINEGFTLHYRLPNGSQIFN